MILRDTTTSRGAHLVEGIVLVPVPDAALPRVPHRTLHLLPGEIVHGGLARREMNARCWSAFYVPLFWVIFSETAVDARLAEIQQVPTLNRLLSVPGPPEEEAAYSRGG